MQLRFSRLGSWVSSAILLSGLFVARPSSACSCISSTPAIARQKADVVFTGQVIWRELANPEGDRPPKVIWTFLVDQVSKGKVPRRTQVYSAQSGNTCGAYFRMGGYYRVYAQRNHQALFTNLCAGNEAIAKEKQQPNE